MIRGGRLRFKPQLQHKNASFFTISSQHKIITGLSHALRAHQPTKSRKRRNQKKTTIFGQGAYIALKFFNSGKILSKQISGFSKFSRKDM